MMALLVLGWLIAIPAACVEALAILQLLTVILFILLIRRPSYAKKGASPSIYINIIPVTFLHLERARSQMINMRKNQPSFMMKQVHTTSASLATTNVVVFLALLLALIIVISVFWIEKRSKYSVAQVQVDDAKAQSENAQDPQPHDTNARSQNFYIHGKLLLPSTPRPDPAKAGELAVTGVPRERPTGLLSRYGETHQQ